MFQIRKHLGQKALVAALLAGVLPSQDKKVYPSVTTNQSQDAGRAAFINGILNTPEDASRSARQLADNLGRPVELIYNLSMKETGKPVVESLRRLPLVGERLAAAVAAGAAARDLGEAIGCKLSPELCQNLEIACKEGAALVVDHLLNHSEVLTIHAHSEGAIISQAALLLARRSERFSALSDADWQRVLDSKIKIVTYGAGQTSFECSDVTRFAFSGDPVPALAAVSDGTKASIVEPSSFTHAFSRYMESYPDFVAANILISSDYDPRIVAETFFNSLKSGAFANKVAEGVLRRIYSQYTQIPEGEESLKTFAQYLEGRLSEDSSGPQLPYVSKVLVHELSLGRRSMSKTPSLEKDPRINIHPPKSAVPVRPITKSEPQVSQHQSSRDDGALQRLRADAVDVYQGYRQRLAALRALRYKDPEPLASQSGYPHQDGRDESRRRELSKKTSGEVKLPKELDVNDDSAEKQRKSAAVGVLAIAVSIVATPAAGAAVMAVGNAAIDKQNAIDAGLQVVTIVKNSSAPPSTSPKSSKPKLPTKTGGVIQLP